MSKQKAHHIAIEEAEKQLKNSLNIKEPPCKSCKFFMPRALTNHVGVFKGISLCSAKEMYRDFSCWEDR